MTVEDKQLLFGFVWVIFCTGVTYILLLRKPSRQLPPVIIILITALLLRAIPALILPRGAAYEMYLFQQTADAFRAGVDIYTSNLAHPYLPFIVYWLGLADWLSENVGLFFIFWLKTINILADVLLTGLVYLAVLRQNDQTKARYAAWIYAFNPVTIMVVAYQGQFDAFATLFLMLAWYSFTQKTVVQTKQIIKSGLLLGIAILVKTWPFIFLPIVLLRLPTWRGRVQYIFFTSLIPLGALILYNFFFSNGFAPILKRAINAGATSGWWGYSSLVSVWLQLTGKGGTWFNWVSHYGKYLGYLMGLLVIIWTRKEALLYSLLFTILIMFATVPNLGLQGLSWIISMALILGMYNALSWYIGGATIHMLFAYWGIHLTRWLDLLFEMETANRIIQLSSLTAWLVIIVWCWQEIRRNKLNPHILDQIKLVRNTELN